MDKPSTDTGAQGGTDALPPKPSAPVRRIVIDLDDTLTIDDGALAYADRLVNEEVVARLREFRRDGYEIVIHTARNMRSYAGNLGRITARTVPIILAWLERHDIPFDELVVGKPWCGDEGFYVDDKALRPAEFVGMSKEEIEVLLNIGKGRDPGQ